jgi:alginate O-acetyltransferase complex protein AlgI
MLGFFKYYNFAASTFAHAAGLPDRTWWMNIVLPIGISFHTFQSISYVVDVYRGEQEAIRDLRDYALFICFFPQLVAGPIVRARDFFRDLFHWRRPSGEDISRGVFLTMLGLTKKMAFADPFARVSDEYFGHIAAHPGAAAGWSGAIAFAIQIYFDFSGYTDMAIGIAKLFGFHFPVNFRRPYLAGSITDFWRRWHISLSSWLRDYIYIPLGGNRGGRWKTYRNLMLTMLIGGLWHGASWNFLIWGGFHGALLSVERIFRGKWTLPYPIRALATFAAVTTGWVFFRAATLAESVQVLREMYTKPAGHTLWMPWHLGLVALALTVAILEEKRGFLEKMAERPGWLYAPAMAVMLLCVELFGAIDASIPFVYFQF